ncbi:MAG: transposase [bacterium]
MATYARIDVKGYFYHVFARGQRKQPLFFSKDDMGAFLNILNAVLEETDIDLYAYAVNRNHYHFIIYRNNTSMGLFMKKLNIRYALYFNNKYGTVGHVFQGRYKSKIVLEESELPKVFNYVHYNPQKHGLTDDARNYPFCSAGFYHGKKNYVKKLKKFNYNKSITSRKFITYRDCIGTKEQYLKFLKRKPGREKGKFNERRRESFTEAFETLIKEHNLNKDVFMKNVKRTKTQKMKIKKIVIGLKKRGFSQAELARYLDLHRTSITKMLKNH